MDEIIISFMNNLSVTSPRVDQWDYIVHIARRQQKPNYLVHEAPRASRSH